MAEIDIYSLNEVGDNIAFALDMAVRAGNLPRVRFLVEKCGASLDQPTKCPPIATAIIKGDLEMVKYILARAPEQVAFKGRINQTTILFLPARMGHLDILQFLVTECGLSIHEYIKGQKAVNYAAEKHHFALVHWLLTAAPQHDKYTNEDLVAVLLHVTRRGRARLLPSGAPKAAAPGATPAIRDAIIAHLVLDRGVKVDTSRGGCRALTNAAAAADLPLVRLLVETYHAAVVAVDSPLVVALDNDAVDVARYLANQEGRLAASRDGYIPLLERAPRDVLLHVFSQRRLRAAEWLIRECNIPVTAAAGAAPNSVAAIEPMLHACKDGWEDGVRLLLDTDGTLVHRAVAQKTPLIVATVFQRLGVVRLLLERGADVDAVDEMGNTALWHAVVMGFHDIATILIEDYSASISGVVIERDYHAARCPRLMYHLLRGGAKLLVRMRPEARGQVDWPTMNLTDRMMFTADEYWAPTTVHEFLPSHKALLWAALQAITQRRKRAQRQKIPTEIWWHIFGFLRGRDLLSSVFQITQDTKEVSELTPA